MGAGRRFSRQDWGSREEESDFKGDRRTRGGTGSVKGTDFGRDTLCNSTTVNTSQGNSGRDDAGHRMAGNGRGDVERVMEDQATGLAVRSNELLEAR